MDKLLNDRGVVNYKISPVNNSSKSKINYDIVNSALKIDGLSNNETPSTLAANEKFIKLIKNVYVSDFKIIKKNKIPQRLPENNVEKIKDVDKVKKDHNIKNYTKLYHPLKIERDEERPVGERLRKLAQLCKKMPLERTPKDIEKIYNLLKTFTVLSSQVENDMLKLLSNIILYEFYDTSDLTFFGNKGFYLLLSGKVKPACSPFIRLIGEPSERFLLNTDLKQEYPLLSPGECFGTLDEITQENVDCSNLLMSRVEGSSEVLLITTSYYRRIFQKYETQKHADKLVLLKTQETFNVWPQQALVRVANILAWVVIPANTLICKEDEISSFLGFIQSGSCYVLRKLDVKKSLPNGKVIIQQKQVLIGTLEKGHSFGEVSLLDQTPMKHSLLTKNELKVMQTSYEKIADLDSDVRLLLRQSCNSCFENFSQTSVESTYMEQKIKNDWTNLKENIMSEVIESRGIRPGQGKWNIMANPKDIY